MMRCKFRTYNWIKIVCFVVCFVGVLFPVSAETWLSKQGVVNLSNNDLLSHNLTDLSGEWQFCFGKHLTAAQMRGIKETEKVYSKVPSPWTEIAVNGKKLPSIGIGTYYLKIILNKHAANSDSTFGFSIGEIDTSYKLWVNNELVTEAGNATTTAVGFKPIYLPQSCYFNSKSDTLHIVIQVSNFYDPLYAGIWHRINFGNRKNIANNELELIAFTIFIFSVLILLFLYQITLSIVHREDKSHIIIAVLAFVSMTKMLCDGPISIFNFIPNLDYFLFYRIWFFSFFIIYLIFRLTKVHYPDEVHGFVLKFFNWFYALSALLFLFVNPKYISTHIFFIVYANLVCIVYLFYVFAKAILRRRDFSVLSFISFTIMVGFIINDLLSVIFISGLSCQTHVGVAIFISIQSITISLKFARSHNKVVQLSEELIVVNKNLESEVAKRTNELYTANLELEKIGKQKDLLISTISHDLIGFFNTLLTFTKAMCNDHLLTEQQKNIMTRLYQTSNKAYFLLDNILAWAKLHIKYNSELAEVSNFDTVVKQNIALFSEKIEAKNVDISLDIDDSLCFRCDVENLNSIVRNLLSNAIKFSKFGSQITVANAIHNGFVQIKFSDQGVGMSPEMQTDLFDPIKNKRREGTNGEMGSGVGLLIVKELVELNCGQIKCYSIENVGTTFVVEFPAPKML